MLELVKTPPSLMAPVLGAVQQLKGKTVKFSRAVGQGVLLDNATLEVKYEGIKEETHSVRFYAQGLVVKKAEFGRPLESEEPNDGLLVESCLDSPEFVWIGNEILAELQRDKHSESETGI